MNTLFDLSACGHVVPVACAVVASTEPTMAELERTGQARLDFPTLPACGTAERDALAQETGHYAFARVYPPDEIHG